MNDLVATIDKRLVPLLGRVSVKGLPGDYTVCIQAWPFERSG